MDASAFAVAGAARRVGAWPAERRLPGARPPATQQRRDATRRTHRDATRRCRRRGAAVSNDGDGNDAQLSLFLFSAASISYETTAYFLLSFISAKLDNPNKTTLN